MASQALRSVSARVSARASSVRLRLGMALFGGRRVGLSGVLIPSQEAGLEHDLVRFDVLKTQPLEELSGQDEPCEVER